MNGVECPTSIDGLHASGWYDRIGPCADCGAEVERRPELFAPHSITWSYDAVQHQVYLHCADCGVSVQRTWADEHSTAAQSWISTHRCGQPEPVVRHLADGSVRRG